MRRRYVGRVLRGWALEKIHSPCRNSCRPFSHPPSPGFLADWVERRFVAQFCCLAHDSQRLIVNYHRFSPLTALGRRMGMWSSGVTRPSAASGCSSPAPLSCASAACTPSPRKAPPSQVLGLFCGELALSSVRFFHLRPQMLLILRQLPPAAPHAMLR